MDIGCGIGFFSCLIAHYADYVIGLDVNGEFITEGNILSNVFNLKNTEFNVFSAHDLDVKYFLDKNINALFMQAVGGGWGEDRSNIFWKKCVESNLQIIVTTKAVDANDIKVSQRSIDSHPFLGGKYKIIDMCPWLQVLEKV